MPTYVKDEKEVSLQKRYDIEEQHEQGGGGDVTLLINWLASTVRRTTRAIDPRRPTTVADALTGLHPPTSPPTGASFLVHPGTSFFLHPGTSFLFMPEHHFFFTPAHHFLFTPAHHFLVIPSARLINFLLVVVFFPLPSSFAFPEKRNLFRVQKSILIIPCSIVRRSACLTECKNCARRRKWGKKTRRKWTRLCTIAGRKEIEKDFDFCFTAFISSEWLVLLASGHRSCVVPARGRSLHT